MQYFFSSDYHFFHDKIREYENRPFKDVETMNSEIVRRHNERVKKDDVVFFLGDLGFYASAKKAHRGEGLPVNALTMLEQMNGKFYRIAGNHDKHSNKIYIPVFSITLKIAGLNVQLIHNPEHANLNNNLIICGHCHGKFKTKEVLNEKGTPILIINVSVENFDYRPITWDEIKSIWDKWLHSHPKKKVITKCLTQLQKSK